MLETDFILMITAGYLLAPETAKEKVLADLAEHYELQTIEKPGRISISGNSPGQPSLPWKSWTEQIRDKRPMEVTVHFIPYERPGLAPHIAAAFAGSVSFVLQVRTGESRQTWYLRSQSSRQSQMTAAEFADFIEMQPAKTLIFDRVHHLINESNALNDRPEIGAGGTAAYLHSTEGEAIFDFLGDNLLSEIQIECIINSLSLSFPPEWDKYFDPPFDNPYSGSLTDSGKEPVYFYTLRDATAEELNQIVDAQPDAANLRNALKILLEKESDPQLPRGAEAQTILKSGTGEQLRTLGGLVCRAIIKTCQDNDRLPVIPASLTDIFGPDEKDQLRARARGRSGNFNRLKPLESPWRLYQFEALSGFQLPEYTQSAEDIDTNFRESLEAITRFAEKQQITYYAGLFRLAAFSISPAIAHRPFVAEDIIRMADENGFKEYAGPLTDGLFYVLKMAAMNWPQEKCLGILAASLTNVFGGMGSWNDLSFEKEGEEYARVSALFFAAHEQYFARQLSHSVISPEN